MPIYEYHCQDCQERVSVLIRSFSEAENSEAVCPSCGKKNLKRLISNFAIARGRTGTSVSQSSHDPVKSDSRSLAQTMREAEARQNFGTQFSEVASRLENRETPDSIERSLRKRTGKSARAH